MVQRAHGVDELALQSSAARAGAACAAARSVQQDPIVVARFLLVGEPPDLPENAAAGFIDTVGLLIMNSQFREPDLCSLGEVKGTAKLSW